LCWQKSGPIAGATFQEVRFGGLSGKAKEVAVSPGGTALREVVTGKYSEGHFFGFAASLVLGEEALAEPKN
jgi:hypothetical protein